MKLRWKISIGTIFFCAGLATLVAWRIHAARSRLAECQRQLTARGEKLAIAELSPAASTNWTGDAFVQAARRLSRGETVTYAPALSIVGPGCAAVGWRQPGVAASDIARLLDERRTQLLAVRNFLLSQPLHFSVDYREGFNGVLPARNDLVTAEQWFASATVVSLQKGEVIEAWENWRACVKLLGCAADERLLRSQAFRSSCLHRAFAISWDALQFDGWTDDQLRQIQQLWQETDFLVATERSVQMERAFVEKNFRDARQSSVAFHAYRDANPLGDVIDTGRLLVQHPVDTARELFCRGPGRPLWKYWWSYSEEMSFLQRSQSILERVRLMGTNRSFAAPPVPAAVESSRFLLGTGALVRRFEQSVEEAAQAETAKEIVIAAIALERFHLREKKYPADLKKLQPDFLEQLPIDRMDGNPLRYHPTGGGKFQLYSVGDNRIDERGDARWSRVDHSVLADQPGVFDGRDWAWPLPATPTPPNPGDDRTAATSDR